MGRQKPGKRAHKWKIHKREAIIVTVFLFAVAATLWVLSIQHIIADSWGTILSAIVTVLGVLFAFLPVLLSFFPDQNDAADTPAQPASGMPGRPIFLFAEPLVDAQHFSGRLRERNTLISRTRNGGSTSIVGPRRIGKTWLISYLKLAAPTILDPNSHIGYLDATAPDCGTVAGFTRAVLEELGIPVVAANPNRFDLTTLQQVVRDLRDRSQRPILCIDEFERFGDPAAFDLKFFLALRSMTQHDGLVLIVASKTPLIDIVGDAGKTSGFFNVFEQITLGPFTMGEADQFAKAKGALAGFHHQEQARMLQYGQRLPIRLQLAGKMLQEDKLLAAQEDANYYRPNDPNYWQDFETRMEEKYRGVVR